MNTHHDPSVAVFTDAASHHGHKSILEAMHMDDVLPLAQQAGKAHGTVDVGHPLEWQDRDGYLQSTVLLEHIGMLAADNLDIEPRR